LLVRIELVSQSSGSVDGMGARAWIFAARAEWQARAENPAATADAMVRRGRALLALRRFEESLACAERVLGEDAGALPADVLKAESLLRLGRVEAASATIDEILTRAPGCADAIGIRALICFVRGDLDAAWAAAARGAALLPPDTSSCLAQGLVLVERGDPAAACAAFERAIAQEPRLAAAHLGRGRALAELGRPEEALGANEAAALLDDGNAVPWVRTGHLFIQLNRFDAAASAFARALERQPDDFEALQGRAQCLAALGRAPEAVVAYTRLLALAPDAEYMRGERFHAELHCCDWREYEATRRDIAARVRRGERVDVPGTFLSHSDSPADQLACARLYAADLCTETPPEIDGGTGADTYGGSPRIRVAYLSADFGEHATAFLAAGLFEAHDRTRFETYGISFGADDGSAMRRRLEGAFDAFMDVRKWTDAQIAARLRELRIDVAVDMKGYTLGGRPRVFAARAAPVQVSFLAYPGTMGASFMDYIVADQHVIPEAQRVHYAEQVIYMPGSYQVNDAARTVRPIPSRRQAGLPEAGFIFGCFNSPYKITPAAFDVWMDILTAVPGSVLWLLSGNPVAADNLRAQAQQRGVDPRRLVFAPWTSAADHRARCGLADLFLDTLPYNAHTTASDALWSGVPLVTRAGATFVSRVATSLLHAVGLAHLSVESWSAYRALAIRLATSPHELHALRAALAQARQRSTLFDSRGYCRQLESAFAAIVGRSRRGEPPSVVRLSAAGDG
jgi:predicted O-linked N-acetylglucosamine transferase (SPINDLY family)